MNNTKSSNILIDGYSMQIYAFFSNEYAMRHILINPDYRNYIEQVPHIKEILRKELGKRYRESHADTLIDRYAFFSLDNEEVNLYSNLINMRIQKNSEAPDENAYSDVESIFDALKSIPAGNEILAALTDISLRHGVYATRIDIFYKKDYSLSAINQQNIHKSIEKLFFKKEITEKLLSKSLHAESPFDHQTLTSNDIDVSDRIALYINTKDKTFDFNTTLDSIMSILSLFICEQESGFTLNDSIITKYYLNAFFNPTNFKLVPREISNRLFGLLMWDMVTLKNMNQYAAFLEVSKTHKIARTKPCECKICNDECHEIVSCYHSARRHFRSARESIRNGTLKTLKDR